MNIGIENIRIVLKPMRQKLTDYASERDGALAIEYGLMTALIGVMIITGASALGAELDTMFSDIAALFGGPEEPSVAAAQSGP